MHNQYSIVPLIFKDSKLTLAERKVASLKIPLYAVAQVGVAVKGPHLCASKMVNGLTTVNDRPIFTTHSDPFPGIFPRQKCYSEHDNKQK